MELTFRSPDDITPYGKNAKVHPPEQIAQIAASIEAFGFAQPIVVDKDGVVIVGHGRLAAAQYLNLDTVPVVELNVSEEQAKAYRLADNKLNESEWDMTLVIAELKELSEPMVLLTGFDSALARDKDERDDEAPELGDTAKTKLGDIIQLGPHRLMCGDSTSTEDVAKLMDGTKADLVFTDPPYNVNYKGQGKNTSMGIMGDNMQTDEFDAFLLATFERLIEATKPGAPWYVFHSHKTQDQFERALTASGLEVKNQLIWNKPAAGLGMGDYRPKHEPFFYAVQKGKQPQFYGDRTHSTVIDFQKSDEELMRWVKRQKASEAAGKTTIWSMKRENTQDYVHPTQKPVELIQYALENSSKAGDAVVDLFGGSGSTMIACEKLGRVSYTMELDPLYVDVMIQRYVDYTENPYVTINGLETEWK